MTPQECKRVETLKRALNQLLCDCVDRFASPKKPTVKQLKRAGDTLAKFIKESKLSEL